MGNKPTPFVLRALCILGPEEILKLAHGLNREEISFKKAAGEDLISWKDEKRSSAKKKEESTKNESKILHFPRPETEAQEPIETKTEEDQDTGDVQIMSSEVILLQREISREVASSNPRQAAKSGYQKANEMYVVKTSTVDGKEKFRVASTNGVLVNKKQA